MENMDYLNMFLEKLYQHITGEANINNKVVRKHLRNLEIVGDLSFPVDVQKWKSCIERNEPNFSNILDCAGNENMFLENLVKSSNIWPLKISNCVVKNNFCCIFLNRTTAFNDIVKLVLSKLSGYGKCNLNINETIDIAVDINSNNLTELNLSELRLLILKQVTMNILNFCNVKVYNNIVDANENCRTVTFTLKSNRKHDNDTILCGTVLNGEGLKNTDTTAAQFYAKRTVDMQLMAQHKYGVRISNDPGWKIFFEKLGEAAATIELLQNKTSHSVKIHVNNVAASNMKGASFILYNCARLANLFKEFDKKVAANIYPVLPSINDIDFNLLTNPEEWELLYVYVLQFPHIIRSCIENILKCEVNVHNLSKALSGMCSTFSIYYRRVRILTEPRSHLFSVLHARMYLLKAVQQALHNGLFILNIEPVKQM